MITRTKTPEKKINKNPPYLETRIQIRVSRHIIPDTSYSARTEGLRGRPFPKHFGMLQ